MQAVGVAVVRAEGQAQLRNLGLLGGLALWMLYTRLFWPLHSIHATIPPCPFLTLTGHPCPFCGGTRSFAYMWQGDVGRAAALYPLGPLLFAGTLLAIPLVAATVALDRDLMLRVPDRLRRRLVGVAIGVLAVSWGLKLAVLPN